MASANARFFSADVAQLVEQALRKRHVAGSSPAIGSRSGAHQGALFLSPKIGPTSLPEIWMRRTCFLVLLLPLLSLLQGCTSSRSDSRPGVLRLPLYPGELVADPAQAQTLDQTFLVSLLYSGLMRFGPDLHVIPDLAVSIPTISGDGSSYTFTVRRDARFADGTHCTAQDVASSLARALLPGTRSALARRYLSGIRGAAAVEQGRATRLSGVKILHRLTLRIKLAHPDATFLQKLAFPASFVVEPRYAGRHPLSLGEAAGTGPWSVTARGRDGSLILSPRRHFYQGSLQLRSLDLVPVRDDAESLDMYKKGTIDASYIAPDYFKSWSSRSEFHSTPGLTGYYAVPSTAARAAWDELDRTRLVQHFYGALSPLTSVVPPAVPDYVPPSGPTPVSDASFNVTVRPARKSDPELRRLTAALAAQIHTGSGAPSVAATVVRRTYLLPVPGVWLSMILPHTASVWFRHNLDETSNLTNDPVSRMNIYSKIEEWALTKRFVIPLASASVGYAIKPAVSGLQVTAFGLMPDNGTWSTVQVS